MGRTNRGAFITQLNRLSPLEAKERREEARRGEARRREREGEEEARHEDARLREVAAAARRDAALDMAKGAATAQAHCLSEPEPAPEPEP